MKNKLKYTFLLPLLALAACSNDDDALPVTVQQPQAGDALEITVRADDFEPDGAADTRATDNGAVTTFENGDRVGIIILDASSNILADNIPYKYNGSSWSFDDANGEGKTPCYYNEEASTYLVYFPYSKEANNVKTIEGLKDKFKPQSNQSTQEGYRASDLMTWSTTGTAQKTLNVTLKHAYASVSLSPKVNYMLDDGNNTPCVAPSIKVSDVSLTVNNDIYIAYQTSDGSYRCILPVGTQGNIRCFYTIVGKTYNHTISISSATTNTRYVSAPEIKDTYSLDQARVGDFYCKKEGGNSYLIPGDVAELTDTQQAACIGIVYSTDVKRIGAAAKEVLKNNGVANPHGLVMALTNASDGCRWGDSNEDENSGGTTGEPFKDNTNQLAKQYKNVDGYAETQWIIDTYGSSGTTLQDTYTAFYHANRYGTTDGGTAQYAAPTNTTGWFIPSMGQWWDILSGLGGIDLSSYQSSTGGSTSIPNTSLTAVKNMNTYLQKISGATQFSQGNSFWSSSEYNGLDACYVYFSSSDRLSLTYYNKNYSGGYRKVRCSFAF
ncbi:fimbrillin family protein [Parabacteroides pacaensis]|uniref:fimbrillin family protein n=1 Tax=Parabacteroides pacaensis TaxID=2086575 RepID=UPI000D1134E9|nr:fimbrillin family protein [Parabacteroides pacaensis]